MAGISYAVQGVQQDLLSSTLDIGNGCSCKPNGACQHFLREVCGFSGFPDFIGNRFVKMIVHGPHDGSLVNESLVYVNIKHTTAM